MCKVRMMMMMVMMMMMMMMMVTMTMHLLKQFIVHHLCSSSCIIHHFWCFLHHLSSFIHSSPSFTIHIPSDALGEAPGASTTCVLSVCHQGEEVLDKAPTPLRDVQGPPSNEDAEVMTLSWVHQFPFCVAFRCFGANDGFRKFRDFWFYIRNEWAAGPMDLVRVTSRGKKVSQWPLGSKSSSLDSVQTLPIASMYGIFTHIYHQNQLSKCW